MILNTKMESAALHAIMEHNKMKGSKKLHAVKNREKSRHERITSSGD
jgi:hypothetical protein